VCTKASARSRRLSPGQRSLVDVTFLTTVDGPGRHGEVIDFTTNDPVSGREPPILPELSFFVTVEPSSSG
jgi:hypothetical protein